jgi:two-component system, cell cycle response regulator
MLPVGNRQLKALLVLAKDIFKLSARKKSNESETAIMELHNLQPESKNKHEPRQLLVGLIGFKAKDEESFNRFFQVARTDKRKYIAASPSDNARSNILLVNYDDAAALREKDLILVSHPQIQVVAVSRGPLHGPPPHHIRGMLFAARVLTALDKVPLEPLEAASAQLPHPETASVQSQGLTSALTPQVEEKPVPQARVSRIGTAIPIPIPVPAAAVKVNTGGYRALVVDDSVAIQKSLELNLATLPQITVIDFADSGESAIEKAEGKQYDLIFLDIMMPGIDGYETCTHLRKKPEYKKTPIIMVSGKTSPMDEVKGVMSGCTTYITKPVQREAFQKLSIRVLTWLENKKI